MLPIFPDRHLQPLNPYQKRKFQHLWTLFPMMVERLPEGKINEVEIRHFLVSEQLACKKTRELSILCTPGCFCQLVIGGNVWMYDILDERIKNQRIVEEARGDVLITGLGLGMILHPILKKPEVRSVRVLENNEDVVKLVLSSFDHAPGKEKLRIEMADAETWMPKPGICFDTIWLDHIPSYAAEPWFVAVAEERIQCYRAFLREESSYIGHWALEEARRAIRACNRPSKRLPAELPRCAVERTMP